jgi:peptide-methionine (R)-S-oxide reductase
MDKIEKSSEEWRAELAPDVYHITREAGTERPFSGQYNHFDAAGDYHCACCGALLFKSQQKFDSHCGWPAFFEQAEPQSTYRVRDLSHGMVREEVRCRRCDAHLGHVFPDGPKPTGERYCINSLAMVEQGDYLLDQQGNTNVEVAASGYLGVFSTTTTCGKAFPA